MADKPYPFGEEEDWRNVLALLVEAHKKWQLRAASANKVLSILMALPPTKRAAMTVDEVGGLTREALAAASPLVDHWAAQVERRLKEKDARNLLEALRLYASQQFWPGA